jgi:Putative peptidoglycan binding domain
MRRARIFSSIGLTLLALSQPTWAAGHGGGGFPGGGGGHFGGVGGRFGGGAVSHPGGPGFSGGRPAYFYSRGTHFATSPVQQLHAPAQQPRTSAGLDRGRISPPTQQARTFARPTFNGHVAERHNATSWHRDWDRRRLHFDHDRFFVFDDGFWFGLDPGFFPWDYYPYYAYDYYPYDYYPGYYADVEPYYYNEGVYSDTPMRDPTVATVQTELTQQGYYGGPVDGIYGPATRDAVAKYQIAKHLDVTGSLSPDTLQSLGVSQVTPS